MISLMAAVMAVQSGLIYQVQNKTASAHAAGIAAAAMLFIFQGVRANPAHSVFTRKSWNKG
jgi:hypothetical protein